ncbi:hypothetical protein SCL_0442 [Sulfuricaulis limicola]|uniref:Uncharacterized protein n=2 Tax=Sulfuricaulis limicola TaxID=1620215 RepID=A0A1B4XD74_9GAMM|nr:hypothetical protein SCL_0442 [Sulfuricaulis limicola]
MIYREDRDFAIEWGNDLALWRSSKNSIDMGGLHIMFGPARDESRGDIYGSRFPVAICPGIATPSKYVSITFYGADVDLIMSGNLYIADLKSISPLKRFVPWEKYDESLDLTRKNLPVTADIPAAYYRCFNFEFDVESPRFDETFELVIRGVKVNDSPISIPTVKFKTTPSRIKTCVWPECFVSH